MMTSSIVRKECRESAISPVRRLNKRVKQGNSLVFGLFYRPLAEERLRMEAPEKSGASMRGKESDRQRSGRSIAL